MAFFVTSYALSKMAVAVSMFRWLDLLEKEFDKTFVDLDILLGEIDPDQSEITYDGRQKMTQLSSSFAQLVHKAQTIFQGNAKLEVGTKGCSFLNKFCFVFSFFVEAIQVILLLDLVYRFKKRDAVCMSQESAAF